MDTQNCVTDNSGCEKQHFQTVVYNFSISSNYELLQVAGDYCQ